MRLELLCIYACSCVFFLVANHLACMHVFVCLHGSDRLQRNSVRIAGQRHTRSCTFSPILSVCLSARPPVCLPACLLHARSLSLPQICLSDCLLVSTVATVHALHSKPHAHSQSLSVRPMVRVITLSATGRFHQCLRKRT